MTAFRKLILPSQLYRRAKICGDAIDKAVVCSKDGFSSIVEAVHKIDHFSTGNASYSDYVRLFSIRRPLSETYANYEDTFSATLTKWNSNRESASVPQKFAAWSLTTNANIGPSHRLGVISAAESCVGSFDLRKSFGKVALFCAFKYKTVARMVCQCDNSNPDSNTRIETVPSMVACGLGSQKNHHSCKKKLISLAKLADLKCKSKRKLCEMYGHQTSEHAANGSLSTIAKSDR